MLITSTNDGFASLHMRLAEMAHQRAEIRNAKRERDTKIGVVILAIVLVALMVAWWFMHSAFLAPLHAPADFLNTICSMD